MFNRRISILGAVSAILVAQGSRSLQALTVRAPVYRTTAFEKSKDYLKDWNQRMPHQGKRECARRAKRVAKTGI